MGKDGIAKRWFIKSLQFFGVILVFGIVGGCVFWIWRSEIAQYAVDRSLAGVELNHAQVKIVDVGWKEIRVADIRLSGNEWDLEVDSAVILYTVKDLWKDRLVDFVGIIGGSFSYIQKEAEREQGSVEEEEAFILPQLPVKVAKIEDFKLNLLSGGQERAYELKGKLTEARDVFFEIIGNEESAQIRCHFDADGEGASGTITGDLEDPLDFFSFIFPQMASEMLADKNVLFTSDSLEVLLNISIENERKLIGDFSSRIGKAHVDALGALFDIGEMQLNGNLRGNEFSDVKASISFKGIQNGDFLVSEFPFEAKFTKDLSGAGGVVGPLRFTIGDFGNGEGVACFQIKEENDGGFSGEVELEIPSLKIETVSVNGLGLKIEGDSNAVRGHIPFLQLNEFPVFSIRNSNFRMSGLGDELTLIEMDSSIELNQVDAEGGAMVESQAIEITASYEHGLAKGGPIQVFAKPTGKGFDFEVSESEFIRTAGEMNLELLGGIESEKWGVRAEINLSNFSGATGGAVLDCPSLIAALEAPHEAVGAVKHFVNQSNWKSLPTILYGLEGKINVLGNHLSWPDLFSVEWFQGERKTLENGDLTKGWKVDLETDIKVGENNKAELSLSLLGKLEGEALSLRSRQQLVFTDSGISSEGSFQLEPIRFKSSDVLSRYFPEYEGVAFSGLVTAEGKLFWDSTGDWDIAGSLILEEGIISYAEKNLKIEGLEGKVVLDSLSDLKSEGLSEFIFSRMALGDLDISEGKVTLALNGPEEVRLETAEVTVLGGKFSLDPFSLFLPEMNADVILHMEGVGIGYIIESLELFNGSFEGRLDGVLPISLRNKRISLGEGYLDLDSSYPAVLSYDAKGIFTKDIPNNSLAEKLQYLPYDLVERGLGNINVDQMRVDLFHKGLDGTPIRIKLKGNAKTEEAEVPFDITTNINGSVAEALNFLLRLSSL
jgi:hypothetical protein